MKTLNQETLGGMTYRDLQKLAKNHGIKANLPKQCLIREIESVSLGVRTPSGSPLRSMSNKRLSQRKSTENSLNGMESERRSRTPRLDRTFEKSPCVPDPGTPQVLNNSQKENMEKRLAGKASSFMDFVSVRREKRRSIPSSTPFNSFLITPIPEKSENTKRTSLRTGALTSGRKEKVNPIGVSSPSLSSSSVQSRKKKTSRIPRSKMPDFAKLHAKEFDKMENLETYLSKRTKTPLRSCAPDSSKKANPKVFENIKIPLQLDLHSQVSTFKSSMKDKIPKSFDFGSIKKNQRVFTFNATPNKTLFNSSTSKKHFDIKQSLNQPLKYKPHKGKLKNWEEKRQERKTAFKPQTNEKKGHQSTAIRGVRMNRRAELLLRRRRQS